MLEFFRNIQIDTTSFWLGFLAGALFFWVLSRLRAYLPATMRFLRQRLQEARESATASVEFRLRNDTIRQAQKQHLASSLFSLDEVAIEPRLIPPPVWVAQEGEILPSDAVSLTVPYVPDWPELAATYHGPTLSLPQALQGGANLLLVGHPGSGKTFALAYLANAIARRDGRFGELADYVPIYLHFADIPPVSETQGALEVIVAALSKNVSRLTQSRLPALVNTTFDGQRAFLILDGLDELNPEQAQRAFQTVKALLEKYPATRLVVACSHENYHGFPTLGLQPLAIAAWSAQERAAFIKNWGQLWSRYIDAPAEGAPAVNPYFVYTWLLTYNTPATPLEITLKTWAAFAGDMLAPDYLSCLEAYLRRMVVDVPQARLALERLSLQMVCAMSLTLRQQEARDCLAQFDSVLSSQGAENPVEGVPEPNTPESGPAESVSAAPKPSVKVGQVLPSLVSNGLIIEHPDSRLSLVHPVLFGYLAGSALANSGGVSALREQPGWSGKYLALCFLSRMGDITPVVQDMLRRDNFLHRQALLIARWLGIAAKNAPWRAPLLRLLAGVLQKESNSLSLGARIVTAIALSGDSGIGMLFRQMLKSDQANLRQLAALGCGLLQDAKAVNDLVELTQDRAPAAVRAACLALVAIGTKEALEAVAAALLHGNEVLRRAAAEALANHPEEGHPALKEGSEMEDLMVRRAVVFGLLRVNQPWAVEILERLQLEDKEWIVRNAAIQAVEEIKAPSPYIPKVIRLPEDMPWLINFAAKLGMGVAPGQPARDLIHQAALKGDEEQRLQALDYLRLTGGADSIHHLYQIYFGTSGEFHEAAFNALWNLDAAGIELPSPQQFGLA